MEPRADLPDDYDPRDRPWYKQAMEKNGELLLLRPILTLLRGSRLSPLPQLLRMEPGFLVSTCCNITRNVSKCRGNFCFRRRHGQYRKSIGCTHQTGGGFRGNTVTVHGGNFPVNQ